MPYGQLQVFQILLISDLELKRHTLVMKTLCNTQALLYDQTSKRRMNRLYSICFWKKRVAVLRKLHILKYSGLEKSYFSLKITKTLRWWQCFYWQYLWRKAFKPPPTFRSHNLLQEKKQTTKLGYWVVRCVGWVFPLGFLLRTYVC